MLLFTCYACSRNLLLSQVAQWVQGEPFCNAKCAGGAKATDALAQTPSREEHLRAFPQTLADLGQQVLRVREILKDWVAVDEVASFVSGGMETGSREEEIESHMGLASEHAALLDSMKGLVKRSMALHAAGLALPPSLLSAIQSANDIPMSEPHGTVVVLEQMFDDLETTNGDIAVWYDAG